MKTVLTIAGFDPSSGAGVAADLMVFAAHGLFGTSCITALTVQSTIGVRATYPVDAQIVGETLECLTSDMPPAGIKIGMLASKANVFIISRYIAITRQIDSPNSKIAVVLDPVVRSSSGRELLDQAGVSALRKTLLPLVDWVTPNLDELALLSGQSIVGREDVPAACRALQAQLSTGRQSGQLGILATGGHLDPPDDFLLMPDGSSVWLPGKRVDTKSTHGTGCALSSAFLSHLVLGDSPQMAAVAAKSYVAGALSNAEVIGQGHGPMKHLWPVIQLTD